MSGSACQQLSLQLLQGRQIHHHHTGVCFSTDRAMVLDLLLLLWLRAHAHAAALLHVLSAERRQALAHDQTVDVELRGVRAVFCHRD